MGGNPKPEKVSALLFASRDTLQVRDCALLSRQILFLFNSKHFNASFHVY